MKPATILAFLVLFLISITILGFFGPHSFGGAIGDMGAMGPMGDMNSGHAGFFSDAVNPCMLHIGGKEICMSGVFEFSTLGIGFSVLIEKLFASTVAAPLAVLVFFAGVAFLWLMEQFWRARLYAIKKNEDRRGGLNFIEFYFSQGVLNPKIF